MPPKRITDLVAKFNQDVDKYRSKDFKELPLRGQFLNPVLEALGWDPTNKSIASYADREVIQEDSVKIGGFDKAPDYAFLIDRQRKFFVEAKRPAVNVKEGRAPAYQIRRYCWSAGLPFGLVTDFEEFAIYDCRAIPDPDDSATVGRIAYFTCNDLQEYWPVLHGMFGRAAVVAGILEHLAVTTKAPRNTRPIDAAFLEEIRGWREDLAAEVAKRNLAVDIIGLNKTVQTLIDRLVFLRIAEARGLEAFGTLREAADAGTHIYRRLMSLFDRADDRYNSGLFHSPDLKQDAKLIIDDALLGRIVRRLYYPEPYEFGVLPADILGRIYEQFLGEVVLLKADRTTSVELKPEVRKAGGVYYTPSPIVDYIVRSTVGPLVQGRTPSDVAKLAIVDPACGSGSFLIAAFQYLIDWHQDYYAGKPNLSRKFLDAGSDGLARLTTAERKRILTNNIYGVDIDPQAVEVAKLSLLLKVIEGQRQMELEVGRLLPDLDQNVVCGNSLIGSDFPVPFEPTAQELLGINPFDWLTAFPGIFKRGGFDAVVGNPPYLNIDNVWGTKDPRLAYIKDKYKPVYADKTDILFYFLKKAADICPGEIGFIVSRSFLEADKAQNLRDWLSKNVRIREVLDFREAVVFPKVGINTAIVRMTRSKAVKEANFSRFQHKQLPPGYTADLLRLPDQVKTVKVPATSLGASSWNFGTSDVQAVLAKLDAGGVPVGKILHVGEGMQTGRNGAFQVDFAPSRLEELRAAGLLYTRARNSDILPYELHDSGVHMLYLEDVDRFSHLPADVQAHLKKHRADLEQRAAFIRGNCDWWRFTWPLHKDYFKKARVFCPYRATENRFAVDDAAYFLGITDTTVLYGNNQPEDLRYITAVLNSRVLSARFRYIGKLLGGGVLEYYENTVSKLPVPRREAGSPDHDELVDLAERRAKLAEDRLSTLVPSEQVALIEEARAVELDIEALIVSMFQLTTSEVALVEAELPPRPVIPVAKTPMF